MSVSDILMEVLAMESSLLRSRKLAASGKGANARDMTAVLLRECMDRVELSCRSILGACLTGETLRRNMSVLRDFASYEPIDAFGVRRSIARRVLDSERYVVD
jgi:hypothetical protein